MSYGILGPLEVWSGSGQVVGVGGRGVRALLALLLTEPGRVMPVARLIDGLYGDDPPPTAANALQSQVSRLRRALGDPALVAHTPAGYRLVIDPGDVDAHRFAALAADGHRALTSGDHARAAAALAEALGLWRGPALADVADAPFADAAAARLEDLRLTAVEDHAEARLAAGAPDTVAADLRPLIAAHPLRERPRAQLMRALHATGRTAEALSLYDATRRLLADELGADPSAELAAAHLAILQENAAPPPAPDRPYTPPPAPLTSFVGRDTEIARIGGLLRDGRLATLLGPGGAGKTRLALEAAARRGGAVAFVDLAPVADGPGVPLAVLAALGLRDGTLRQHPGAPADATDRLAAALAEAPPLLILDNCEHVVEAAAALVHRLLAACPGLRVLATSREPLAITGEALCPVPPLPLPPDDDPSTADAAPAVRLFTDRAAAVRPGFALDADTRGPVLRICRALDGLPLAIELAAARLRTLPVTEVADRLDDVFGLLSRGDRTAAPRHRTLRAVIGWSWDLLSGDERALARRLTVFAGGATAEAARAVCGLPGAADLLDDLAEKSLIEAADGRYRMLETVRAFGADELAAHGEADTTHRAHAAYVLALAEDADPHLRGHDQLERLDALTAERGNLLAATRWAAGHDTGLALRLIGTLSLFWYLRGLRAEVAPLAQRVLDAVGTPPADRQEEYILCAATAIGGGLDTPELRAHMARAHDLMYGLDHYPRLPFTVVLWAVTVGPPRSPTDTSRMAELLGHDAWSAALLQVGTAFTCLYGGDVAGAEDHFTQAVDGYRAIGDRWGMTQALDQLATIADWHGDHTRCIALLDEAMSILTRLGALEDSADVLCRRADSHARAGALDAARADYLRAIDLFRRTGGVDRVADPRRGLADLSRLSGDLDAAEHAYNEITGGASAISGVDTIAGASEPEMAAWIGLGRVAEARGDAAGARARHSAVLRTAAGWNRPVAARAVEGLAGAAVLDGDGGRAAVLHGLAAAIRGAPVTSDPDVERVAAAARALVGAGAYTEAYARAAATPGDKALAELGVPVDVGGRG
ncbi:MAG TPA: BTAD domain-containing putative transcriptional regulator [Streptosporangiaceae bacterium]